MGESIHEIYLTYLSRQGPSSLKNADYYQAASRFSEIEEKLAPQLQEDSRALLSDLLEAWSSMERSISEEAFSEAFRLGANLMLEILKNQSPTGHQQPQSFDIHDQVKSFRAEHSYCKL